MSECQLALTTFVWLGTGMEIRMLDQVLLACEKLEAIITSVSFKVQVHYLYVPFQVKSGSEVFTT